MLNFQPPQQQPQKTAAQYATEWSQGLQNIGNTYAEGIQQQAAQRRQQMLDQIMMQNQARQKREDDYKYGVPLDPNQMVSTPMGQMGHAKIMDDYGAGGQPQSVAQGSPLIEAFQKWRSGGMNPQQARPEYYGALPQEERSIFQKQNSPEYLADIDLKKAQAEKLRRPDPAYVIPEYDPVTGQPTGGYTPLPKGTRPAPYAPVPSKGRGLKTPAVEQTYKLYETARDGLLTGLENSVTGPIMGRIPAFTSDQQVAQGGVAAMAPVLKQLFRAAGEGVFTDRDQALLLEMVPTRATLPEARTKQIQNIDNIVKAKLGIGSGKAGGDGGGDPLGLR